MQFDGIGERGFLTGIPIEMVRKKKLQRHKMDEEQKEEWQQQRGWNVNVYI